MHFGDNAYIVSEFGIAEGYSDVIFKRIEKADFARHISRPGAVNTKAETRL